MKKIINKPENVVTEMLDGLAYVHSDLVHRVDGFDIIVRNEQAAGQVGLISGGGSGHEPAHAARTRRTDQIVAQQRGERQGHG